MSIEWKRLHNELQRTVVEENGEQTPNTADRAASKILVFSANL